MGYWLRGYTEHLLIGIRGNVPAFRNQHPNIIYAERGRHSAKPDASYALIETLSQEPRLELFARRKRPGWHTWGNEVSNDVVVQNGRTEPPPENEAGSEKGQSK
jgi:N6-adenosine-specific RNA methylase IME4